MTPSTSLPLATALPDGLANAWKVVRSAFAKGLRVPRRRTVAQWAAEERVVSPDSGSRFPGKWSNDITPHLVEPMECCTLSHPARHVTFRKCHQSGFSEVGLNLIGSIIQDEPAPILVVLPTTDEVKKYVRTKLDPMIEATPSVAARVKEQKSRDEKGSTTTFKRFTGGFLQCTGANSSAGLQMITARVIIREEVSEYPDDVDGRGDPAELAEKRATTWEGYEKIVDISTPAMKGACRITARFERSDQRFLYLPCPQCGVFQWLQWARLDKETKSRPTYACLAHGCVIEHTSLRPMLRRAVWLKTYPGDESNPKPPDAIEPEHVERWRARSSDGRDPGFAFSALTSPFMSWTAIVRQWLEARGNPAKEKVFVQQVLGEAWEEKGEAPDHEKLFEKRVVYDWRRVPHGALFLTGAADVQGDRIEWAVYAWGPAFSSWLIDKGVIEGDPEKVETWRALDDLLERSWADGFGKPWKLDAFGIDAGYLSQVVYRWVRHRGVTGKVFALDGRHGWRLPALGTPTKKDVDFAGKRVGAVLLWPVGTWDLKSELYSALRKMLKGRDADGHFEPGVACYGEACDLAYLQQLAAEQLVVRKGRHGLSEQVWEVMIGRRNEAHDIAIYARALAHHLGDGMTPEQWATLAANRGARPEDVQRDMAALWSGAVETEAQPPAQKWESNKPTPNRGDLDRRRNWIRG